MARPYSGLVTAPVYNDYWAFQEMTVTCPHCGWTGSGNATKLGDYWEGSGVAEYHCPKCLAGYAVGVPGGPLAIVQWPRV